MTEEGGREWYHLKRYDFAYNRRCFLGILKVIRSSFKPRKNRFKRLGPKKGGVCFEGAYMH
jgi:hypothetical protein